ncbi:Hypothetical protein MVR_LOCUS177 [uncultured virus]|nr:Hypothetical protein MVR_LOCUS177 [uncultured virus]
MNPPLIRKAITIDAEFLSKHSIDDPEDLTVTDITWTAGLYLLMGYILEKYPRTRHLNLSNTGLTSLAQLVKTNGEPVLPLLVSINCSKNKITSLYGLHNLPWLTTIDFSENDVESLAYLEGLRLVSLFCKGNPITDYRALLYLPKLCRFERDMMFETTAVQSAIKTIICNLDSGAVVHNRRPNLYLNDPCAAQAFDCDIALLIDPEPNPIISFKDADTTVFDMRALTIILELCADLTVHPLFGITFAELMDYIWSFIMASDQPTRLIVVFCLHMLYSNCLSIEHLFRYAIQPFSQSDPTVTYSRWAQLDQLITRTTCSCHNTATLCSAALKAADTLGFDHDTALALTAAITDHADLCFATDPNQFPMYSKADPNHKHDDQVPQ